VLERSILIIAQQMASLMQQHGRAFAIVDGNLEEFRIKRHDLEWKICGGVSVAMSDVGV
jgi:hypothetical protein